MNIYVYMYTDTQAAIPPTCFAWTLHPYSLQLHNPAPSQRR